MTLTDLEVLTTKQLIYTISDPKTLQFIRYIYLLKICDCCTEKICDFVEDVRYGTKYTDKIDLSKNREGFSMFCKYMLNIDNIVFEKNQYYKLFKGDNYSYSHFYIQTFEKKCLIEYFNKFMSNEYLNIFDKHFLEWLIKCSMLLD